MGRRSGVTVEQTRQELVEAAARVFARHGFEGSSVADICAEAGLSTGPLYTNFGSKEALFGVVLEHWGKEAYDRAMRAGTDPEATVNIADTVTAAGRVIERGPHELGRLVVEAFAIAGRDETVAGTVRAWVTQDEQQMTEEIRAGQGAGVLDETMGARSMARMNTIIALGAHLTRALDLDLPDQDEWSALVDRLVDSLRAHP
ncbi:MAG: TetR/AcrR family transcriptional regulator [Microthrixaceae bacterium]|nr:TetR/AcrR family transcriptional regulator [Microthrixaceae bacterium]